MLGFIFGAPETEPTGAPDSPRREAVAAAASRPSFRERLEHAVFPTIHVEKVELGVARIAYVDDTRGPDAKFTFAGRLDNPAPILLHELTEEDGAPNRLHWKGSIEPIASEVDLQLSTNLSSFQPTLGVGVRLSGIRGDAIEKVMPTMSVRVDPAGFESGEITFHADASMQVLRNTLLDFGFSRNFGLDLTIENFALRGSRGAAARVVRFVPRRRAVHRSHTSAGPAPPRRARESHNPTIPRSGRDPRPRIHPRPAARRMGAALAAAPNPRRALRPRRRLGLRRPPANPKQNPSSSRPRSSRSTTSMPPIGTSPPNRRSPSRS